MCSKPLHVEDWNGITVEDWNGLHVYLGPKKTQPEKKQMDYHGVTAFLSNEMTHKTGGAAMRSATSRSVHVMEMGQGFSMPTLLPARERQGRRLPLLSTVMNHSQVAKQEADRAQ